MPNLFFPIEATSTKKTIEIDAEKIREHLAYLNRLLDTPEVAQQMMGEFKSAENFKPAEEKGKLPGELDSTDILKFTPGDFFAFRATDEEQLILLLEYARLLARLKDRGHTLDSSLFPRFVKQMAKTPLSRYPYSANNQAHFKRILYVLALGIAPENENYEQLAPYKERFLEMIEAEKNLELKRFLLERALDPKHALGKLFWTKRGFFTAPQLNKGVLRQVAVAKERASFSQVSFLGLADPSLEPDLVSDLSTDQIINVLSQNDIDSAPYLNALAITDTWNPAYAVGLIRLFELLKSSVRDGSSALAVEQKILAREKSGITVGDIILRRHSTHPMHQTNDQDLIIAFCGLMFTILAFAPENKSSTKSYKTLLDQQFKPDQPLSEIKLRKIIFCLVLGATLKAKQLDLLMPHKKAMLKLILESEGPARKTLLTHAKDEKKPLGQVFWKQRGPNQPSIENGTLAIITRELKCM